MSAGSKNTGFSSALGAFADSNQGRHPLPVGTSPRPEGLVRQRGRQRCGQVASFSLLDFSQPSHPSTSSCAHMERREEPTDTPPPPEVSAGIRQISGRNTEERQWMGLTLPLTTVRTVKAVTLEVRNIEQDWPEGPAHEGNV